MGWLKPKQDPFSTKSRDLDKKIAKIRSEIGQLKLSLDGEQSTDSGAEKGPAKKRKSPGQSRPAPPGQSAQKPSSAPQPGESPKGLKQRFSGLFSKQKPVEERFVSYFAAGSFESARPLRYERRVARNRTIFVSIIVLLFLFTIISFFW